MFPLTPGSTQATGGDGYDDDYNTDYDGDYDENKKYDVQALHN